MTRCQRWWRLARVVVVLPFALVVELLIGPDYDR